jgi:hypothetical protein
MHYEDKVSAAAAALAMGERANWELARLTYLSTPGPGERARPGETVPMAQWCRDVQARARQRFSTTTGGVYRKIWSEYGERTDRPMWTEAYESTRGESADVRMASFNIRRGLTNASPEIRQQAIAQVFTPAERVDLIREQLADPSVRAEIAAQPYEVRSALTAAVWQGVHRTAAQPEPTSQTRQPTGSITERMDVLHQASLRIQRLATELESEAIRELLQSEEGALWPGRVALRGHLEHLRAVTDCCIELLPSLDQPEQFNDATVIDVVPARTIEADYSYRKTG